MSPNYDSSQPGVLYRRVDDLRIRYSQPNRAAISAQESDAVLTVSGEVVRKADTRLLQIEMQPADFAGIAQLVDQTTGAELHAVPQQWLTLLEQGKIPKALVMLGILAMIRAEQKRLDAAEAQQP